MRAPSWRRARSLAPAPTATVTLLPVADRTGRRYPDKLDTSIFRIAGVCVLVAVMTNIDITAIGVAQRALIADFHSNQAVVGWTVTGYTLALAAAIPMAGWAADRCGTKRLFIGSVLVFTSGSLLCVMAPNLLSLIVFRMVQGLGGGILLPLNFTIVVREAGTQRLGQLMAVLGIPMMLGPIGGPILGGWLIETHGWRWIFGINLPIGLIALVLAGMVLPKDRPGPAALFDLVGMLLLSPGLATFLYGMSSMPSRGTVADRHVLIPAGIGLALMSGFVVHVLHRTAHPLIDLRLLTNRSVTLANLAMFLFAIGFFGAELLFPSYLQQLLHQTPLQSGFHMVPQGLGAMLAMPLAGTTLNKHGPAKAVLVGITLTGLGMGIFAHAAAKQAGYLPTLFGGLAIIGFGAGCTMMPLSAAAVQTLSPHQIAPGSTLISVNQQVAGSIGVALMSMILTSQFSRSENIATATGLAPLQQDATIREAPVVPLVTPHDALARAFVSNVSHDLAHAYATVFVLATVMLASIVIPAAFLATRTLTVRR